MNRLIRRLDEGRVVYRSDWITVCECAVERDGVTGTYSMIERPDAVIVVPLTPTGRTAILKQFRFPTNESSWELPMGAIESGELAESAARRELFEEVGLSADGLVSVGAYRAVPGLTAQRVTVFVGRVTDEALDTAARAASASEEIQEVRAVAVSEVDRMVRDGSITDGFSLAGFLLFRSWRNDQAERVQPPPAPPR